MHRRQLVAHAHHRAAASPHLDRRPGHMAVVAVHVAAQPRRECGTGGAFGEAEVVHPLSVGVPPAQVRPQHRRAHEARTERLRHPPLGQLTGRLRIESGASPGQRRRAGHPQSPQAPQFQNVSACRLHDPAPTRPHAGLPPQPKVAFSTTDAEMPNPRQIGPAPRPRGVEPGWSTGATKITHLGRPLHQANLSHVRLALQRSESRLSLEASIHSPG